MDELFVAQTFKDLANGNAMSTSTPSSGSDWLNHPLDPPTDISVPESIHKLLFDTYWQVRALSSSDTSESNRDQQSLHILWPLLYCPKPEERTPAHFAKYPILYNAICAVVVRMLPPDALKSAGHTNLTSDALGQHFFNRARYHLMRSNFDSDIHTVQAAVVRCVRDAGVGTDTAHS
jgi:hypothetical protein